MNNNKQIGYLKLEADVDGNVLVACPKCNSEFKALAESLKNDDVISCPNCKNELTDVNLTQKDVEQATKTASDWAVEHTTSEVNKIINDFNSRK